MNTSEIPNIAETVDRLKMATTILPPAHTCVAAAELLEYLQRRLAEYEDTIRHLTLQLGKTL